MDKEILQSILVRPIAYHPQLAKISGSVNLAILISQLLYWTGKQHDKDGWIHKTSSEINEETALTRRELDTARKLGKILGILEENKKGVPARIHYRINIDKISELLTAMHKSAKLNAPKRQTRFDKSAKLSISESTTENTTIIENNDFNSDTEILKLRNGNRKDLKIIALYWTKKKYKFENKVQFNRSLKRDLKPASELIGYTGIQIAKAIQYCEKEYEVWTLETINKRITDLVNVKN